MQERQETWVRSWGREDPLEKEMAPHSSILVWKIPWTEEPGGLQSMGLQQSRTQLSNQTARTIATYKLLDFDNVNDEPHFSCLNFNASIMEHL